MVVQKEVVVPMVEYHVSVVQTVVTEPSMNCVCVCTAVSSHWPDTVGASA